MLISGSGFLVRSRCCLVTCALMTLGVSSASAGQIRWRTATGIQPLSVDAVRQSAAEAVAELLESDSQR